MVARLAAVLLSLFLAPALLAQDHPPEGAIWNYSISPVGIGQSGYQCVLQKLPGNPATNLPGWAPSEGDFYSFDANNFPNPPIGLAKHILDCLVPAWTNPQYCFEIPTPIYTGFYPHQRVAEIAIFSCAYPPPMGTLWQYTVGMVRQPFFPPPLMSNGFEQ